MDRSELEAAVAAGKAAEAELAAIDADPLRMESRKIVAFMPGLNALQADAHLGGEWDAGGAVDITIAALRRGMEITAFSAAVRWPEDDWFEGNIADILIEETKPYPACFELVRRLKAYQEQAEKPEPVWIEWLGGECPVPSPTRVEVRLRNGDLEISSASDFTWPHDGEGTAHIVAYRILSGEAKPKLITDSLL